MSSEKLILFEPWNLGDAVIAFATALQDPERIALACNSRWLKILRCAAEGMPLPNLISVDLGYVTRSKHRAALEAVAPEVVNGASILSIRGDMRDYRAARILFPASTLKMTGWIPFLAHRSSLVNYPFARGLLATRNRYKHWAALASVQWSRIEAFYGQKRPILSEQPIVVHVGAQWASKQYPHAAELARMLRETSKVLLVAAPRDSLPEGIRENEVLRLVDSELVRAFRSSSYVISNDSGPMHLAAFLRCRTIVVTHRAAMAEWMPPGARWIPSANSPKGYKSMRNYLSDTVYPGWPAAATIANCISVET